MATVTSTPVSIQGEHRVVIRGVGWQGYQSLLEDESFYLGDLDARSRPRQHRPRR